MGTPTNTETIGDETVEDIKAALDAPEAPAEPILFPVINGKGEDGFNEAVDFITVLQEAGLPLSDPQTWKQAGLRGHGHMVQIVSSYALESARNSYERAVSKQNLTITADTWKDHAAHDYEAAAGWLFRTNCKLFSDRSYAKLGGSMAAFYDGMQKAYADLVYQTVRVADAMLDADEENPQALDLIERMKDKSFRRLGIESIDDAIANMTGITANELDLVEHRAIWAKARTRLKELIPLRFSGRNKPEYGIRLLNAWAVVRNDETILDDPTIFEGTNFNRHSLEAEVNRVVDLLIQEPLARLEDKNAEIGIEELQSVIENFQYWRSLFGESEEPDDIDPDEAGDDFWRAEILDQYGYRSFTHMMESLCRLYGGSLAKFALFKRDSSTPDEVYDALMEARESLEKGGMSLDRVDAFDQIALDRDAFFTTLDETAPAVIDRNYSEAHYPGLPCKKRLELLTEASDALDRIYASPYQEGMSTSVNALAHAGRRATLRQAEERLALSLAAHRGHGLYRVMKPAVDLLEEVGMTLNSTEFHDRAGMNDHAAKALVQDFERADMTALWNAAMTNEEDPLQRLVYAIEFESRLNALSDQDEYLNMLLLVEKDWEEHYTHLCTISDQAMNAAVERMNESPNDTLSNAQFIQAIRNALALVSPDALEHPAVFKRMTGKDLAEFLKIEKETGERVEQLCATESSAFKITREAAGARLGAIKAMPRGADGWTALRDLRHSAGITGFSIADDDILAAAQMNELDMAQLNYDHAIAAARDHLDSAIAKGPGPISLNHLRAHAYNDYVGVCKWVTRTNVNVLADDVYQDMGLAGRTDFIDRMRESLFDYMLQLETAIIRDGVTTVGPVAFLGGMEALRNAYQLLGFDNYRDDASEMPQDIVPNAVNVRTVRLAIEKFRPTACLSVLNSDRLPSAKHRRMRQLLGFGKRMQVPVLSEPKNREWDIKYTDVIHGRLNKVLDGFAKNPDDMARGWRVARAIEKVRAEYDLERLPWFDAMFQRMGYGHFKAFCEDMAIKRLDQVRTRCERRRHSGDAEAFSDGVRNCDMVVDIGRMYEVIESPFIDADRITIIMNQAKVTREWMEARNREAAPYALPTLANIALDPAMNSAEREEMIAGLFDLREVAGTKDRRLKCIDWDLMASVRTDMSGMIAAQYMLHDMVRANTVPTWSTALLRVYAVMEEIGLSMGNENHLRALGLSDSEAQDYAKLDELALPYSLIVQLENMDKTQFGQTHNLIVGIFAYAKQKGIDLYDGDVQRQLGIRSNIEMQQVLMAPTLYLARSLSATIRNAADPAYGSNISEAMQKFLAATSLETRLERKIFDEQEILDGTAVAGFMEKFRTMLGGNGGKPDALAPA